MRVAVEARTSGTFPLRLTVTSADGGLAISDTRFRVRSTAVSTVGIALMVGAGVFLAAGGASTSAVGGAGARGCSHGVRS